MHVLLTSNLILAIFCTGLFLYVGSLLMLFFDVSELARLMLLNIGTFILIVGCVLSVLAVCFGVVKDLNNHSKLSLIHISEPTRLGMISYAVFCLKKKKKK